MKHSLVKGCTVLWFDTTGVLHRYNMAQVQDEKKRGNTCVKNIDSRCDKQLKFGMSTVYIEAPNYI